MVRTQRRRSERRPRRSGPRCSLAEATRAAQRRSAPPRCSAHRSVTGARPRVAGARPRAQPLRRTLQNTHEPPLTHLHLRRTGSHAGRRRPLQSSRSIQVPVDPSAASRKQREQRRERGEGVCKHCGSAHRSRPLPPPRRGFSPRAGAAAHRVTHWYKWVDWSTFGPSAWRGPPGRPCCPRPRRAGPARRRAPRARRRRRPPPPARARAIPWRHGMGLRCGCAARAAAARRGGGRLCKRESPDFSLSLVSSHFNPTPRNPIKTPSGS